MDDILRHAWFHNVDFEGLLEKTVKAPWLPRIKNDTDASNFEQVNDDKVDKGVGDTSSWDKDF